MGRLVVIEGCDGSGKATQAELLLERLKQESFVVEPLDFPCYNEDSSIFVRQYLSGEFGKKPDDVNAYAASMFYAVDRYVSYKRGWGSIYENTNTVFVANRYTTSNAVHQMQKLKNTEWNDFLKWLFDFEYRKLSLPVPDLVIYLDIPTLLSEKLILERYLGDESRMDIHEADIEFQKRSRTAALYCAEKESWKCIDCSDGISGEVMRSKESISDEILQEFKRYFR